jgi:hypothetical protein
MLTKLIPGNVCKMRGGAFCEIITMSGASIAAYVNGSLEEHVFPADKFIPHVREIYTPIGIEKNMAVAKAVQVPDAEPTISVKLDPDDLSTC